ncbi:MAG: autotransporter outer membrane beta-barrel domain-containing protein [Zavarzinia sp.]|nr:autotransporter outer membrane beta-barrel domain-containing protein [Zavarzinia sp.]
MMSRINGAKHSLAVSAIALTIAAGFGMGSAWAQAAIIDNGTVAIGVNPEGNLITGGVGLTFLDLPAGGQDALAPGCACEAWGVADFSTRDDVTPFFGNAGEATGDRNLFDATLTVSGTGTDPRSTGDSAISTVNVGAAGSDRRLSVTHEYSPSVDSRLYEVDVSITNIGTTDITELRYRRAMDWDIPPTEFSEFVTIAGLPAGNIVATSDNGFANGNPLEATGSISAPENENFEDNGPADHGATFDFHFGNLAVGDTREFVIFYGAAANEAEALDALRAVGAEVYSLGQSSGVGGAEDGTPATFIFAFAGVGGTPIGGQRADFTPLYVDIPMLVSQSHFRNVGLRLSGKIGGGETSTLSTVASMMDGAPAEMGAAAGDTMANNVFGVEGLRAFLTGSYNGSSLSSQPGFSGSDTDGFSITTGIDYELMKGEGVVDSMIAGIGFGWSGFSSDIHDAGSDVDGTGLTLLAYGSTTIAKDLNIDLTVGYSWIGYDSTRDTGLGSADGDIDARDLSARLGIGYDIALPNDVPKTSLIVTPYLDVGYSYAEVDSYTETGSLAVSVEGFSTDSLTTEVGLRGSFTVPSPIFSDTVILRVSGGWVHEFLDDGYTIQQQLGTTTLTARTGDPDRDYARITGGLAFPVAPDFAMGIDYDGTYGNSDSSSQMISLRSRVAF